MTTITQKGAGDLFTSADLNALLGKVQNKSDYLKSRATFETTGDLQLVKTSGTYVALYSYGVYASSADGWRTQDTSGFREFQFWNLDKTARGFLIADRIEEFQQHYRDDFYGAALKSEWTTRGTGTAQPNDQKNGVFRISTEATSNAYRAITFGNFRPVSFDEEFHLQVRFKLVSSNTNTGVLVGFARNAEINMSSATAAGYFCWFGGSYSKATFAFRNSDASNFESRDSAQAVDSNFHTIRIETWKPIPSTATNGTEFWIDDIKVGQIENTNPNFSITPFVGVKTFEPVAKSLDVDYFELWSDRAS